ncbi:MAG: type II toxin-antitoxin system VapB family antitoxin [Acidaminococcaceae bacterium]|nr:type II toxin-antitoxin system VapB family antitoxin [Acidaminococcaceae bacterium]
MLAKVFENGRSQAIRIPKEYRVNADEVMIRKIGNVLMIAPRDAGWDEFFEAMGNFSADYMEDGCVSDKLEERETL